MFPPKLLRNVFPKELVPRSTSHFIYITSPTSFTSSKSISSPSPPTSLLHPLHHLYTSSTSISSTSHTSNTSSTSTSINYKLHLHHIIHHLHQLHLQALNVYISLHISYKIPIMSSAVAQELLHKGSYSFCTGVLSQELLDRSSHTGVNFIGVNF